MLVPSPLLSRMPIKIKVMFFRWSQLETALQYTGNAHHLSNDLGSFAHLMCPQVQPRTARLITDECTPRARPIAICVSPD